MAVKLKQFVESMQDAPVIAAVKGETIRPNLGPNYVFRAEEHLLVLGRIEDIRKVIR